MPSSGVSFGPFFLDTVEWRLSRDGVLVPAQDKVLVLLDALTERPGRLWTREELHARLWPGVFVSDDALFQAVRKARQALGDDPRAPAWIETVQGRGYRFLGSTRSDAAPSPSPAPPVQDRHAAGVRCPPPGTTVIGREAELTTIRAAFEGGARLVSLVGPAGAGKTTLALVIGSDAVDARFVDLLEAEDAAGVLEALGEGLGADSGGPAAEEAAFRALPTGPEALVVLDNAELCTGPLAALLRTWLPRAPSARFLVTSRKPLELGSEHVVRVGPLAPNAAARLFRARAAARGVVLADEERERIDAVVEAVDGLPLALELSASRVGLLGLEGLLARLAEPLALLKTTRADLPERHRSIRSALLLSWNALDAEERAFLAGCCVFRAPFRVEDAEAVVAPDGDALDLAQAVVDASLVRGIDTPNGRLLAPYVAVRELAFSLADSDRIDAVRHRHLDWLAGLSDTLPSGREPRPSAYARLGPLLDDGVQAMRFARSRGRRRDAARVARWLIPVMARRGAGLRAAELLDELAPFGDLGDLEPAMLLLRALLAARGTAPEQAPARFEAAADRARTLGSSAYEAAALLFHADATIGKNVVTARPLVDRATAVLADAPEPVADAVARGLRGRLRYFDGDAAGATAELTAAVAALRADEGWWTLRMYVGLAEIAFLTSRYDASEAHVRAALDIAETAGAPAATDHALAFLAVIRQAQGRTEEALALLTPVRERARRTGDAEREQHHTYTIGGILGMLGRLEEATAAFEDSLRLARQQHNLVHEGWTMLRLAGSAWRLGRLDGARRWLLDAMDVFRRAGRPMMAENARTELGWVELLAGDVAAAERVLSENTAAIRALEPGPRLQLATAFWAEARVRCGDVAALEAGRAAVADLARSWAAEGQARGLASLGMALLATGDLPGAADCLARAEAIRAQVGDLDGDIARAVRRLREAIS